jgi:hypothetical protein
VRWERHASGNARRVHLSAFGVTLLYCPAAGLIMETNA